MAAGGPPGGFDFNAWQAMNGNKGDGGGAASGEAMTLDDLTKKGADKAIQTTVKFLSGMLGMPVNTDIEGKGVIPQETNVGSGLSLSNAALLKDMQGGVLARIFKYFERALPKGLWNGDEGGNASGGDGASGAGGGDYATGGGGDYGGSSGGSASSSDMPSHASHGSYHADVADARVMYGDKIIATSDIAMSEIGNLKPQSTPMAVDRGDVGMSVT